MKMRRWRQKAADGWDISWDSETGRNWFWRNLISKDICSEKWGDGIRFNTNSTYWDDGDNKNGDGCSSTCSIESGWICSRGSNTIRDLWKEIWGDEIKFNTISTYWDDGNIAYLRWYKPVIICFLPSIFSNSKRTAARVDWFFKVKCEVLSWHFK